MSRTGCGAEKIHKDTKRKPARRIGVFGGAFNPLHLGHLMVADDVRRGCRLDSVLFLAGPRPPHKTARNLAPWPHRRAMLRLGLAGWPHFRLSPVEERLAGPGYTVDALAALRRRQPDAAFHLVLGADQYRAMSTWHEPERLTDLARVIVISRPGTDRPGLFPGHRARRVRFVPVIEVAISGSEIRDRLARGRSVRYMLPVPVCRYIRRHRLYERSATCPRGRTGR